MPVELLLKKLEYNRAPPLTCVGLPELLHELGLTLTLTPALTLTLTLTAVLTLNQI